MWLNWAHCSRASVATFTLIVCPNVGDCDTVLGLYVEMPTGLSIHNPFAF